MDSCVPGDIVTVSGIVKVNSIDEGSRNVSYFMENFNSFKSGVPFMGHRQTE